MRGEPLPKQMKLKSPSDKASHSEMKSENKGDRKYTEIGATRGMHGKSLGGHPSIRAGEFNDRGEGHHVKPISTRTDKGNQ